MFSPAISMSFGRPQHLANVYKQVGVQSSVASASAHQLVQMLFDGFVDAVTLAQTAMRAGQVEAKGRAVTRAVRILDEGLKASLNLKEGGRLAADLHDLYAYTTLRLTQANLRNDERALQECLSLIQPLREAWAAIADQVQG
ncbi:MAG: flagellar export chaperone FliS [Pseudomonadota bacterium]